MRCYVCTIALNFAGFPSHFTFAASIVGLPDIHLPSNKGISMQEKEYSNLPVFSRKRSLSVHQSRSNKQIKPSMIDKEFLWLTDHLNDLMQFSDPKMITEYCSSLMASDIHNITVFPTDYVKKLNNYNHTPSLLKILSSFWTWSDHSVLRTLLQSDSEAASLLDEYDAQMDLSQPLASYPLPLPSPFMVPSDDGTHTILAIKCVWQYYQCLLKDVVEVRSHMIEKFGLTSHSLQLLATQNSLTILYWLIPKSVVTLISTKVSEYSSVLHTLGIQEVSIYPGTRITMKPSIITGSLAFLSPATLPNKNVRIRIIIIALYVLVYITYI